jgi:GntR family transcriptional repressor for pyruvate dehydrogenase complex
MATHERIYTLLDDKEIFLREHEEVYDAIVVRDLERAARLMKAHVQRVYKTLQNGIALEEVYGEES